MAARLARAVVAVRTMIGAPDYARYLAHQRTRHPDVTPLSREAFARERERARYEGTGSRCC
ncbi:MAG: YbdD/YjiX family protein [Gemmatimonadota bacterium]